MIRNMRKTISTHTRSEWTIHLNLMDDPKGDPILTEQVTCLLPSVG